jgi:hypothetical protein
LAEVTTEAPETAQETIAARRSDGVIRDRAVGEERRIEQAIDRRSVTRIHVSREVLADGFCFGGGRGNNGTRRWCFVARC